ncbi:MAG: NAD(P)-binding domain-containing protein [Cytophagales bacterium]|nr:NAD(P)-binding domain-containing protein [Cytophagales bacterium]
MKIAVIGAGNVGLALAKGWKKAGYDVQFGVRDINSEKVAKAKEMAQNIPFKTISEAIQFADTVVVTTPPDAIINISIHFGDMGDKVVIDATNSIRTKPGSFATAYHAIKELTNTKHIVKCFNSTGFENMSNPIYQQRSPVLYTIGIDMYYAGDSKKAKQTAEELAVKIGFEKCYDFGGEDKVVLLEQLALCWINLAIMQGHGRDIAFKIIKRNP